jgi:hypothetical protein
MCIPIGASNNTTSHRNKKVAMVTKTAASHASRFDFVTVAPIHLPHPLVVNTSANTFINGLDA